MKEERKRILQLVEIGKLTVDEALTLLEELEKTTKTMEQKQTEIINELSTVVKFEEAKKKDKVNYKFQSAKEKMFDFVDSVLKKIKDADLDFNFGQSIEVSHIFHQGDAHVKGMDVDVANGSVKIIPWDQPDVRIECRTNVYRAESQEQARQNFLKDVIFAIEGEKLRFSIQQKWMKIEALIYIPQADYENVNVRVFNGSIHSENLKTDSYIAKSANGKIHAAGLCGDRLEVETANGQIDIQNSHFDSVSAETINGGINLGGDVRNLDLHTFNGNIMCALKSRKCESAIAKAATGSIEFILPEKTAVNGELKSNLGSFTVELEGVQIIEEKSEIVQKYLRFKPIEQVEQVLKLAAETKTGGIMIRRNFNQ